MLGDRYLLFFAGHNIYTCGSKYGDWLSLPILEDLKIQNTNILEGTLAYISPEQTGRMNRGIDYRSDFYSLGVTFYQLLTGRLPFYSTDSLELIYCHLAKQPISADLVNIDIPLALAQIVGKLMAKNAENRYQNALEDVWKV
nr:hypothetical protein [Chamaesiphon sp. VAR_48_metabat_135_sub]